jgi:hypothetical protein
MSHVRLTLDRQGPFRGEDPTIAAYRESVRDLYRRLGALGIDAPFLRSHLLPDWWRDELADSDANRALAEAFIAKQLGFKVEDLRDSARQLRLPALASLRFKRYKNEVDDKVRVSALVAQRAATALVRAIGDRIDSFQGGQAAAGIREAILRRAGYVDLASLLQFCWEAGIPVVHLAHRPAGSKPFDGMAAFIDGRPIIVLATGRDGPPWLAFHVAHELGHVMLGHVHPGTQALVDETLTGSAGGGTQEKEADRFALELLTGFPDPRMQDRRVTGARLAVIAAQSGPAQGVDPGVYALIYAKSTNRWPAAQIALGHLGLDTGGREAIAQQLRRRLEVADLSETEERLLTVLEAA